MVNDYKYASNLYIFNKISLFIFSNEWSHTDQFTFENQIKKIRMNKKQN